MKLTILSTAVIFACCFSAFAQTQDTTWFNADWRETAATQATFYRVRAKQGASWQVIDHYISGKVQMTGTYSDDSCKIKQGEFTWFDTTGLVFHRASYKEDKENGKETFTYPNKKV